MTDLSWQAHAACAEVGGEIFFPPVGASVEAARRICENCPVRQKCLEYGLFETDGIYAGTTPAQRRKLRVGLPRPPRRIQMVCQRAGHDWNDPNNVGQKSNGARYCAECDRDKHRAAAQRRKGT